MQKGVNYMFLLIYKMALFLHFNDFFEHTSTASNMVQFSIKSLAEGATKKVIKKQSESV